MREQNTFHRILFRSAGSTGGRPWDSNKLEFLGLNGEVVWTVYLEKEGKYWIVREGDTVSDLNYGNPGDTERQRIPRPMIRASQDEWDKDRIRQIKRNPLVGRSMLVMGQDKYAFAVKDTSDKSQLTKNMQDALDKIQKNIEPVRTRGPKKGIRIKSTKTVANQTCQSLQPEDCRWKFVFWESCRCVIGSCVANYGATQ